MKKTLNINYYQFHLCKRDDPNLCKNNISPKVATPDILLPGRVHCATYFHRSPVHEVSLNPVFHTRFP